jgi:branched-chain amino acid transport system substrate-binding protein
MTDELKLHELAKVSKLFEVLDEEGRKQLVSLASKVHFDAGQVICREGEAGDEFYVVARGQVRVTADDLGTEKELARLGSGEFFGEQAVLGGHKRAATVTALTDVDLVAFPRKAVDAVLAKSPAAHQMLSKVGLLRSEDAMEKMSQ